MTALQNPKLQRSRESSSSSSGLPPPSPFLTSLATGSSKVGQVVRKSVKKSLEAEHLKKFTAVSRQIESQRVELENLRKELVEERERMVRDIKESHRLELQELERKYKSHSAETVAVTRRYLPKTPDS